MVWLGVWGGLGTGTFFDDIRGGDATPRGVTVGTVTLPSALLRSSYAELCDEISCMLTKASTRVTNTPLTTNIRSTLPEWKGEPLEILL